MINEFSFLKISYIFCEIDALAGDVLVSFLVAIFGNTTYTFSAPVQPVVPQQYAQAILIVIDAIRFQ